MDGIVQKEMKAAGGTFRLFYFFAFFGFGVIMPLIGVYLKDSVHLTGTQIGTITSVGPIVMIFIQPLWGMLCDYTQKPREVLFLTLLATGIIGFLYSTTTVYSLLLVISIALAFSQSAIIPISDSVALYHVHKQNDNYGAIRQYGSLGFAIAVLIAGRASQDYGTSIIFYLFSASMIAAAFLTWSLPRQGASIRVNLLKGCKILFQKREFVLFLCSAFFIFGPNNANNTYFGLLIMQLGGTLTAVGIVFLLSAGSEAPFMRMASYWIEKVGVERILILSAAVSAIRWFFYFFEPPLLLVYVTTIVQGLSIGFYVPSALQYVRDVSSNSMRSTAVALYAATGSGFGTWFCTIIGGILMDQFGIRSLYLFYFFLTLVGIFLLLLSFRSNSSSNAKQEL